MKKTLLFLTVTALVSSGCSKTWSGVKQDSSELFIDTKEVIHEATAPSAKDSSTRIVVPNSVATVEQSAPVIQAPANTQVARKSTSKIQVFTDEPTVVSTK